MTETTSLFTTDGKPIYTTEFVDKLRESEEKKKNSKVFIAQLGAQESDLHSSVDILVTGGNRGGGKANPYSTPVATPSGFRKMGELEIGDLICTPYNGVQKVENIFEQGENTIYTFHFDDGTEVKCMDNHRFWARAKCTDDFKVMTAREIMNLYKIDAQFPLSLRSGVEQFVEIPLCGEVELNEKMTPIDLPIHPFALGYISGTGFWKFDQAGVKISQCSYQARMFYALGYKPVRNKKDNFYYLKGITDENRRKVTCARTMQPARIPKEYMTASIQSRWEYIRGIMFVSGRSQKKHPYIALPNKQLIEDIAQMARSLGMWARVSKVEDDLERVGFWRCSFISPSDKKLFKKFICAERAHINAEWPTSPNCNNVLTKKIQYITKSKDKKPCRCITVSGRDHLYMTDAYTINHNTAVMLMEGLYDIRNTHYQSILFRKNKDDFSTIENESRRWFRGLGKYNKSKDDMTWNFSTGAKMAFGTYDMAIRDFDDKYRGQQYAYIGIDELPQMPFEYLRILMSSNRNSVGVRSRILGTCNPDPMSWLRKFIDWWIGKEDTIYSDGMKHPERKGLPIPERDGVVRYCFMNGASVDDIVWGDTPEEVYEQCKNEIDEAWDDDLAKDGYDKVSFAVKSVTFIRASIKENKALLRNDKGYISSILNKTPEERAKEWDGNWDVVQMGNDIIQAYHMEKIFANAHMTGDQVKRATCDIAGTGGDNCVTWLWIGWHIADVFVCRRDPYTTVSLLRAKLHEWGVLEQNFAYDLNGMGQVLKGGFPKAVPFNNQEAVAERDKGLYDNQKSQCAYKFAERTQQTGWSIEHTLLYRKYKVAGETRTVRDILLKERKCIKQDVAKEHKGWCLIHKEQMKHKGVVGHSPDFFEALFMREKFELMHTRVEIPSWIRSKSRKFRTVRTFKRNVKN